MCRPISCVIENHWLEHFATHFFCGKDITLCRSWRSWSNDRRMMAPQRTRVERIIIALNTIWYKTGETKSEMEHCKCALRRERVCVCVFPYGNFMCFVPISEWCDDTNAVCAWVSERVARVLIEIYSIKCIDIVFVLCLNSISTHACLMRINSSEQGLHLIIDSIADKLRMTMCYFLSYLFSRPFQWPAKRLAADESSHWFIVLIYSIPFCARSGIFSYMSKNMTVSNLTLDDDEGTTTAHINFGAKTKATPPLPPPPIL